jgi:hypothetical protein
MAIRTKYENGGTGMRAVNRDAAPQRAKELMGELAPEAKQEAKQVPVACPRCRNAETVVFRRTLERDYRSCHVPGCMPGRDLATLFVTTRTGQVIPDAQIPPIIILPGEKEVGFYSRSGELLSEGYYDGEKGTWFVKAARLRTADSHIRRLCRILENGSEDSSIAGIVIKEIVHEAPPSKVQLREAKIRKIESLERAAKEYHDKAEALWKAIYEQGGEVRGLAVPALQKFGSLRSTEVNCRTEAQKLRAELDAE